MECQAGSGVGSLVAESGTVPVLITGGCGRRRGSCLTHTHCPPWSENRSHFVCSVLSDSVLTGSLATQPVPRMPPSGMSVRGPARWGFVGTTCGPPYGYRGITVATVTGFDSGHTDDSPFCSSLIVRPTGPLAWTN
jgi:hypothetical protein